MTVAITRLEMSAADPRSAAAQPQAAKAARRMLAIALVLEGWSGEACAMDRQTLRDWVHRYNEFGLEGLFALPRCPPAAPLDSRTAGQQWHGAEQSPHPERHDQ
jgi:hypothetical protein